VARATHGHKYAVNYAAAVRLCADADRRAARSICGMSATHGNGVDLAERAWAAVAAVRDPEIGLSLGRLGMVRGVDLSGSTVTARIALTVPGCPMKQRIAD
jgi:hypothetical protein